MARLQLHTGPVGRHKRVPLDDDGILEPPNAAPLYTLENGDTLAMEDGSPVALEAADGE